ncbi:MAG: RNA polymerase sigma factor [Candidatus Omnitrophota bacterium]|nr:RNA polymerase sigma factor [Candidatus Omnitrophota bacterium]
MLKYKEEELAQLVGAFSSGDEAAGDRLLRLIHGDIFNIAYRYVGNHEDAKDVLQEVFVKIYRRVSSFRNASKFSTWLFRVTANTALDFLRARSRVYALDARALEDTRLMRKLDTPDVRLHMIREALVKLSERQKNVFILKHYQGLTIDEISRVFGCSPSSVKTHLGRAVESLQRKLEVK